ncbi:MAG: efflux RND transporter periplasmic adaptor subunit [Bryobacteraceae bacterium]
MKMMMMQAVPVRAVAATSESVPLNVTAVGTVQAIHSVDVKSQIAGQITEVNFEPGQNVRKGQLLFQIDPQPVLAQIAQIQADINKDIALEQQAQANKAKDQATLKQNQAVADRALALGKAGINSKEQTEQAVATADASKASVEADEAAIKSATASLKADRAQLAAEQLQLSYTKITAPISGRAGAIAVRAGNLVGANGTTALVTLLQMSPIYVSFGLPEQLLPQVQQHNARQPLLVTAGGDGEKPVTGKLVFIDNTVDTTTGTVNLKAQFKNPDLTLWPGEFVNTQLRLQVQQNQTVVPTRTVENGPNGKYVWVMDPATSKVTIRPVQVARNYTSKGQELAVIESGVHPGEMVISEGQMRLRPGAKVKLLKPDTQTASRPAAKEVS